MFKGGVRFYVMGGGVGRGKGGEGVYLERVARASPWPAAVPLVGIPEGVVPLPSPPKGGGVIGGEGGERKKRRELGGLIW